MSSKTPVLCEQGEAEIKWEIELLFKMLEKHTLDKI